MKGLHIKYVSALGSGNAILSQIESYRFDNENQWQNAHNKDAGDGKVFYLKCKSCNSNNWTDNGRFAGELECDSCGQFLNFVEK